MDYVLVFPLILAFLSTGQSFAKAEPTFCYDICPAGYYKYPGTDCGNGRHRCEKCNNTFTFTEVKNTKKKCLKCSSSCGNNEVAISPCSFNRNTVCDCKEGFYNEGDERVKECRKCDCKGCVHNGDYNRKCQEKLQRNESKVVSNTTATATITTASNGTLNPAVNRVPNNSVIQSLYLVGVVVTLLVLFCLLLFTKNLLRDLENFPCWSANKDPDSPIEDPKLNERGSHQGSSPTTLTISEETPMMTLSPATPEHPTWANLSPLQPHTEHKAPRQDERWPAVVLYAIIKEVPLRRWKEFLRLLSVADHQLERVEMEAGLAQGSIETQYQMLRLWSQRSSASLDDVFSALRYMDLCGCSQLLQESLEKLQWRPELKQGATACTNDTDQAFNRAMQDT